MAYVVICNQKLQLLDEPLFKKYNHMDYILIFHIDIRTEYAVHESEMAQQFPKIMYMFICLYVYNVYAYIRRCQIIIQKPINVIDGSKLDLFLATI